MALTVGDRDVRPLTADEVLRMVELGILSEDEPVELLHGALTAMSPKSPEHEAIKARLNGWLGAGATAGDYEVRVETPILVPDRTSLPEPDLAVVPAGGDPLTHHRSARLVVEVAVSSLRVDTRIKPVLYAAAGVPDLWVVDVDACTVLVHRDPRPDGYATVTPVRGDATLEPLAVDVPPLHLPALFAGLAPRR
jgi:Uma2 family endonuclease